MSKCMICGKGGIFVKLIGNKYCPDCAGKEIEKLLAVQNEAEKKIETLNDQINLMQGKINPDVKELEEIRQSLSDKKIALEKVEKTLRDKTYQSEKLEKQIVDARASLLVVNDSLEFESFALYTPKYTCTRSEEYKEKLDAIREEQKSMIKAKTATWSGTAWTVNNSQREGKTFMADMGKLLLRAFNNECDATVADVKFSNFDRCMSRIEKSFETINKLGHTVNVGISIQYKKLKMEELMLVYEYQLKKQEEKEALRALKEQQREEAKLQKEIEEARKETEKEKKHYLTALQKLRNQALTAKTEEEKEAIHQRMFEIEQDIENVESRLADIDYRQDNQRAGYVYIISNIGSFGEGVYKIGMTRRLDPYERVYELGDASVPFRFDTHAMIFTEDAPKLEAALHQAFAERRVNMVNHRREYFRVSLDEIKDVVRKNHDKTVEFIEVADAQQYRESLALKN